MRKQLIRAQGIKKYFRKPGGQELLVLDNLNLSIAEGEIVALLGKSGSGKSTLLRIIAGLVPPSEGQIIIENQNVHGPVPGVSMVFQSFALMPWLTVLQNVELGLESMGLGKKERRERALKAIDMIGLDGFESAYPKELSGGMRQRVGFARALVVRPKILLMDEPFSALDVLTAEALRKDLMNIWLNDKENSPKAILFVTHHIEEAAEIADRILVFGSNPGYIKAELPVKEPYPRVNEECIKQIVDDIYFIMTTPLPKGGHFPLLKEVDFNEISLSYPLPDAEPNQIQALVTAIYEEAPDTSVDLPVLADLVSINIDEFYSLSEAMQILHLAKVSKGDISLTQEGKFFAQADLQGAKKIFSQQLLQWVPVINYICEELMKNEKQKMKEEDLMSILEKDLSESEAERVFKIIISWGRYAEIFAYDFESGYLSLENPD